MIPARISIAAIVLFLSGQVLAEEPALPAPAPAKSVKPKPPALTVSGPYEDAPRGLVRTYNVEIGMKSVAFLPSGRSALIAGVGGIEIVDLATGRQVRTFADKDPQGAMVNSAAISRDGRYVLAGQTHRAELWDIASGTMVRAFKGHHGFVNGAALLPNGKHGLSVGDEGHFFMWDLQTGQPVRDFSAQGGLLLDLKAMAVTADGRYALTGGGGAQSLRLWDLQTGKEPVRFDGNRIGNSTVSPAVRALAISRDGRTAVTGGADKILCVWELKTGTLLRKIAGNPSGIGAVALSPDGRFAVTGNDDQIKLWQVSSGKELHEFANGLKHIYSIAFSPDGRFILSGGMGDALRLWDASTWTRAGE